MRNEKKFVTDWKIKLHKIFIGCKEIDSGRKSLLKGGADLIERRIEKP